MDANNHPQSQKENQPAPQPPRKGAGANAQSRRIFSKRWVYPAIYLGAAAIIIGLMYVKSQVGTSPVTSNAVDQGSSATQTATAAEKFQWPVLASANPKVTVGFFNPKGSASEQANALVFYDNGYYAHQGYDIQAANQKAFSVEAAVGGKVTAVSKNPLYGNIVEVTSTNGYVERYESLGSVKVKQGDTIKQGQVLGISGTCDFEKSQGNHVFFEVMKSGAAVDPATVLPKM